MKRILVLAALAVALVGSAALANGLPDTTNDMAHNLTMKAMMPGHTYVGPEGPVAVYVNEDGLAEARFEMRTGHPANEFCFYWDGEKIQCDADDTLPQTLSEALAIRDEARAALVEARKAQFLHPSPENLAALNNAKARAIAFQQEVRSVTPLGNEYVVTAALKADGSGLIVDIQRQRQIWYWGPRIGLGPIEDYANIPFNPKCPSRQWLKLPDGELVCVGGDPDAVFGEFACDNPPPGKELCSISD